MKKFTTEEIRDLFNRVMIEEIGFSEMVEVINEMVSEAEDTPEGLKKGDSAIFWHDSKKYAVIRFYEQSDGSGTRLRHKYSFGFNWKNAVKFESIEQYKKLLKGEL